jgi:hypothetical protein
VLSRNMLSTSCICCFVHLTEFDKDLLYTANISSIDTALHNQKVFLFSIRIKNSANIKPEISDYFCVEYLDCLILGCDAVYSMFNHEDGRSMFPRNVGKLLIDYTRLSCCISR